jgi:Ca-activated chloride channel homolog
LRPMSGRGRTLAAALATAVASGLLVGAPPVSRAQEEAPPALLLVMDSSGSMNGDAGGGQTKIAAAKQALNRVVDSLPDGSRVGLRVYGHRVGNAPEDKARGCKDTELIAPVGPLRPIQMKSRIASFEASGYTPIGISLEKAAEDLSGEDGDKTIVLVSDGIDTCAPPPPCKVVKRIVRQGIDLRIDTVGFQVDARARRELKCIARVGKGTYVDANSADELADHLADVSLRALRTYEVAGTPVTGGATDIDAPALEPGQYTDSILPNQERWYAVDVAEGQTLDAAVTLVGQDRSARFGVGSVRGAIVTPDGDEANQDFSDRAGGIDNVTLNMSSGVVGQTLFADRGGTYYVSVSFESDNQALSQTEFPLEVIVEVAGDAVQPTPTVTPDEPVDEGEEPGGGGSAEGPSRDAGGDAMTGVAGSILFLVAGLVLGMFATRKLRGGARA